MKQDFPYSNQQNYQAWHIDENKFPKKGTIREQILFILKYGILAPSTHNTQPWLFTIKNETLVVSPDLSLALPQNDPKQRFLYISMGCCIENICVAAEYFGFIVEKQYRTFKDTTFTELAFKNNSQQKKEFALFASIPKRFSDKSKYIKKYIDNKIIEQAQDFSNSELEIKILQEKEVIQSASKVYQEAAFQYVKSIGFRNELSRWLRPNNTRRFDGMPGFVAGIPLALSYIGSFAIRFIPPATKKQVLKDTNKLSTSPAIGCISSKSNTPIDWIKAGEIYQRTSLFLCANDIRLTPMTAIVEEKTGKNFLQKKFALNQNTPHMFFRIGYSYTDTYHTPRRSLDTFLH